MAGWQSGSCRGLQILVHRFNSGTGLQILFRLSSAVEQSAVNRSVICSNQIVGAKTKSHPCGGIFFLVHTIGWTDDRRSSFGAVSWRKQALKPSQRLGLVRSSSPYDARRGPRSGKCSNQIVGAKTKSHPCGGIFFGFNGKIFLSTLWFKPYHQLKTFTIQQFIIYQRALTGFSIKCIIMINSIVRKGGIVA